MNPLELGMLASLAGRDPSLMADLMSRVGVPPPGATPPAPGGLPSFVSPAMTEKVMTGELASLLAGKGGDDLPPPMPPPPVVKDPAGAMNPMQALQGFKAPQVDNRPIMNAGVSGAQKSPELTLGALKGGSSAVQALMGLQPRMQIPGLAELLRGVG